MTRLILCGLNVEKDCFSNGQRYPSGERLYYHLREHDSKYSNTCDICGKVLLNSQYLYNHKILAHRPQTVPETMEIRQRCDYCGHYFKTKDTLRAHILNMHIHTNEVHQCEICGFISTSRQGKKIHIRNRHEKLDPNPHKCTVCGKGFRAPAILREHLDWHKGENFYDCEYCTSTFRWKKTKAAHIKNKHPIEYDAHVHRRVRNSKPKFIYNF